MDTWDYRSFVESLYGSRMGSIDCFPWCGMVEVSDYALLSERPSIRTDFCCHKKSNSSEYFEYIKWKRLVRSRTGYLVPYQ